MADIFVSHIHEEAKVAEAVHHMLRENLGTGVKIFRSSDRWELHAGENWLGRIKNELASSKVILLLLSEKSIIRPWVNFEAGAGWIQDRIILPVCFRGFSKKDLQRPYSDFQAVDLPEDWYYLVTSVAHHLNLLSPPPPPPTGFFEEKDECLAKIEDAIESLYYSW